MLKGKVRKYRRPKIKMDGQVIKSVDNFKYLGVVIDEEMRFDTHVRQLTERIRKLFMNFMILSRESCGYSCSSFRI